MNDLQLRHKGFTGSAVFNQTNGCHEGLLLGISDRVMYQAATSESLIANFEAAVEEYMLFLETLSIENDSRKNSVVADRPIIDLFVRSGAGQ